ncbi:Hypothetical protein R9X50_00152900 [Acrodontium crateriforme]|uniref:SPX domain-containing protein n=1 Tax=Acrodontium crateriforme TaxID=150365 RepID=A0AAQ3M2L8_9PEZI|nr:Hypothetical protein R9X50_00152900 [Acrodontium crateriforme]
MKFGHEYEQVLASEGFPEQWLNSAIDYKYLKKCIKKVHRQLLALGLDGETLSHLSGWVEQPDFKVKPLQHHDYYSAAQPDLNTISEEFTPQLRILVDAQTGQPLDATLTPETKATLQGLAQHEMILAGRKEHLGTRIEPVDESESGSDSHGTPKDRVSSITELPADARWVQVPLASAQRFFDLLAPKLEDLEALRAAETRKLEEEILDLGDAVENVVEPVREGFEAKREISYRDLYFWREMFRLYLESPIFYSESEQNRGPLTFAKAKERLEAYDKQLRETGLLSKMKTPAARQAAKQFLDLNVDILKIMHFQEVNARAMVKILKKFDKQTHLEGRLFLKSLRDKYPELVPPEGSKKIVPSGFANSIARDLHAEIASKILAIVPQLDDWNCPVCYAMAWRPVSLGCCRSVFCIRCIIKLQDEGMKRCPCCNKETVMSADGRNIDFETMDFLEKYFPLEVKRRQKENEKAQLVRDYGEEFVKPSCTVM